MLILSSYSVVFQSSLEHNTSHLITASSVKKCEWPWCGWKLRPVETRENVLCNLSKFSGKKKSKTAVLGFTLSMLNNPQPSLKQEVRSRFCFPFQGPLESWLLEYAGAAGAEGWIVLTCAHASFFFFFFFKLSALLFNVYLQCGRRQQHQTCVSAALRLHRAVAATLRSVNTVPSRGFLFGQETRKLIKHELRRPQLLWAGTLLWLFSKHLQWEGNVEK